MGILYWRLTLVLALTWLSQGAKSQKEQPPDEVKPAPKEGDACEPSDERWYPVADDQSAFLFCDVAKKCLKLHKCNSNDGLFKVFEPKQQQCVVANEEYRWLLMAPPAGVSTKKVGDQCAVNRDCSDGMFCNGGKCACYLNYIEINLTCVRITSVCQGTTYYPEQINGKPKICSASGPCPPGYVCRFEPGGGVGSSGQENGFCCLATVNEVCGQASPQIVNGQPVPCYSPNASESCPSGYSCQLYQLANRHYCCQNTVKTQEQNGSTPSPPPASSKARHVQHPDSFCTHNGLAYLYDGYPIVCNPNNSASCPKDFPCQKNERINLHFCCQNVTAVPPPPPSLPPPPPLPPFTNLVIPETGPNANIGPVPNGPQSPFPAHLGSVVGGAMSGRAVDFCGSIGRPFIFDGRPVTCSMNDSLSCPPGFACTIYQPFNASFCCRSGPPAESHLPYEHTSQSPVTLTSSTITTAAGTSAATKSPTGHTVCGAWGIPYTYEGYPVTCVNHGPNSTCPPDHVCQFHPPSTAHFCCRIPDSTTPSTQNPTSTSSTPLNPTQTSAPYLAISNPDGCPPQTYAARDHNGVIQVCDLLLAPDSCPSGTGCLYSALFGRYQCCGARLERWPQQTQSTTTSSTFTQPPPPSTQTGSSTTKGLVGNPKDECPPGQVVYRDPTANDTSACAANHADSCPGGYFCQWSQTAGKFLCCGISAGCPNQGVAYVSAATWEIQRCGAADPTSTCPPGYSCQLAIDGSHVCCSSPLKPLTTGQVAPGSELPEKIVAAGSAAIVPPPPSHLCPVGLPLNEQTQGGYRTCSESAVCPSGYQCLPSPVGTVCCPIYQGKVQPPLWHFHSANRGAKRN